MKRKLPKASLIKYGYDWICTKCKMKWTVVTGDLKAFLEQDAVQCGACKKWHRPFISATEV